MNMYVNKPEQRRVSGSVCPAPQEGRASGMKDNRPVAETVRVLQQKMEACPAPRPLSYVPGYGNSPVSRHSGVIQGKGVAQRRIGVGKSDIGDVRKDFEALVKERIQTDPLLKGKEIIFLQIFDIWARDQADHNYKSVPELFDAIRILPEVTVNRNLGYKKENHTRVGFEIEVTKHYLFTLGSLFTNLRQLYSHVDALTNQTLATFYLDEDVVKDGEANAKRTEKSFMPVLEMLIDDVKPAGKKIDAQIEFRTVPLKFEYIHLGLDGGLREAINNFDDSILNAVNSRLELGNTGFWVSSGTLPSTRTFDQPHSKMTAPALLAQHATLSIEPEAFGQLSEAEQALLIPRLGKCKNRQQFYERLVEFISSRKKQKQISFKEMMAKKQRPVKAREYYIDASTGGRNEAEVCFKSPLEALLAADDRFNPGDSLDSISEVFVSKDYKYPLKGVAAAAERITATGQFPGIQGEGEEGTGSYAIAEKLQPLLLDEVSGVPRILFEHRGGMFVNALNAALGMPKSELADIDKILRPEDRPAGVSDHVASPLEKCKRFLFIAKAAKEMDTKRREASLLKMGIPRMLGKIPLPLVSKAGGLPAASRGLMPFSFGATVPLRLPQPWIREMRSFLSSGRPSMTIEVSRSFIENTLTSLLPAPLLAETLNDFSSYSINLARPLVEALFDTPALEDGEEDSHPVSSSTVNVPKDMIKAMLKPLFSQNRLERASATAYLPLEGEASSSLVQTIEDISPENEDVHKDDVD